MESSTVGIQSNLTTHDSSSGAIEDIYRRFAQPSQLPGTLAENSTSDDIKEISSHYHEHLCSASEKIVITGRTNKGTASVCANTTTWHYRFGTPGHITYEFPHDNSPPQKKFAYQELYSPKLWGGFALTFTDHGTKTRIYAAHKSLPHNSINTVGGVNIHNSNGEEKYFPFIEEVEYGDGNGPTSEYLDPKEKLSLSIPDDPF